LEKKKNSEEKTEQLILEVEKKTIFFEKFRHDYRDRAVASPTQPEGREFKWGQIFIIYCKV